MGLRRTVGTTLPAVVLALVAALVAAPPASAEPSSLTPPTISGEPAYRQVLVADPGTWSYPDLTFTYQWNRDGGPIAGATRTTYRAGLDDIGHRLTVTVVASDDTGTSTDRSAPTPRIHRAEITARGGQRITGVARWTRSLTAHAGRFSTRRVKVHFHWERAGRPIPRATGARYRLRPADVGRRVRVQITAKAPGYVPLVVHTASREVKHRIDTRRVVRYHVETRGRITTSLAAFRRLAQETYDDPRGWRDAGIEFRRVARGGAFTLVLAQASLVPSFSSGCSSQYSCRVGRYVIINQDRWKYATPPWNAAHGTLRDYRHMVVNHETGHWLGLGHAHCAGRGRLAPVMQQQSKGLEGCRFNPFPTAHEIAGRTPHGRLSARTATAPYVIAD